MLVVVLWLVRVAGGWGWDRRQVKVQEVVVPPPPLKKWRQKRLPVPLTVPAAAAKKAVQLSSRGLEADAVAFYRARGYFCSEVSSLREGARVTVAATFLPCADPPVKVDDACRTSPARLARALGLRARHPFHLTPELWRRRITSSGLLVSGVPSLKMRDGAVQLEIADAKERPFVSVQPKVEVTTTGAPKVSLLLCDSNVAGVGLEMEAGLTDGDPTMALSTPRLALRRRQCQLQARFLRRHDVTLRASALHPGRRAGSADQDYLFSSTVRGSYGPVSPSFTVGHKSSDDARGFAKGDIVARSSLGPLKTVAHAAIGSGFAKGDVVARSSVGPRLTAFAHAAAGLQGSPRQRKKKPSHSADPPRNDDLALRLNRGRGTCLSTQEYRAVLPTPPPGPGENQQPPSPDDVFADSFDQAVAGGSIQIRLTDTLSISLACAAGKQQRAHYTAAHAVGAVAHLGPLRMDLERRSSTPGAMVFTISLADDSYN